jgi:predicted amidohydrolase
MPRKFWISFAQRLSVQPTTMADPADLQQLAGDLGRLLTEADRFSGAELIVALFELAENYRNPIERTFESEEDWREIVRTAADLRSRVTRGTIPQPDPDFFRLLRQLAEGTASSARGAAGRRAALATLAALFGLDDAFRESGQQKVRPVEVERGFFTGRSYWLIPFGPDCQPPWSGRPSEPGGLSPTGWLSSVCLLPSRHNGVALHLARLGLEWDALLRKRMEEDSLAIAVSPLSRAIVNGYVSCGRRCKGPQRDQLLSVYRLTGQQELARLGKILETRVLPQCAAQKASVLLLPELTISPELRAVLARILEERFRESFSADSEAPQYPLLIVAGSYHEKGPDGRYVNRAMVLDYRGRPVDLVAPACAGLAQTWRHDKVEEFELPAADLAGEQWASLRRELGIEGPVAGGVEPEAQGAGFTVVVSSIGRICIAICIDYLRHGDQWRDAVQGAWMDWLWVPSASLRLSDYSERARDLAIAGAGTVVVNACWLVATFGGGGPGHWAGFAHLPGDCGTWRDARVIDPVTCRRERTVPPARPCSQFSCTADGADGCVFVLRVPSPS